MPIFVCFFFALLCIALPVIIIIIIVVVCCFVELSWVEDHSEAGQEVHSPVQYRPLISFDGFMSSGYRRNTTNKYKKKNKNTK